DHRGLEARRDGRPVRFLRVQGVDLGLQRRDRAGLRRERVGTGVRAAGVQLVRAGGGASASAATIDATPRRLTPRNRIYPICLPSAASVLKMLSVASLTSLNPFWTRSEFLLESAAVSPSPSMASTFVYAAGTFAAWRSC